ncbi:MAG: flagellar M-ring protein FliF, partial [Ruminiclostridium sp.]
MNKVLETLKKFGTSAKTKWTSLEKKTRIITLAVAGVIIVSAIILTVILNQKRYAVLFSGTSSADSAEILNYVQNTLGVSDIIIAGDGDILVPQDQVENIRVQCSMQGYPASGFNYDIWDTGISMFSTESDKREKQKQQL